MAHSLFYVATFLTATTALLCSCQADAPMIPVEVAYQTTAKLGEGPVWNPETQELYWVDIENRQLHIFNPKTGSNRHFEMPSRVGTVVPATNGDAVVALEDGIYSVQLPSGQLHPLSDVEADQAENRFNDGKCDPAGRLWVGSMNLAQQKASGQLYMVESDGRATPKLDNITISNGIVWTKDAKTMYYIDTPTGKIRAFDFDLPSGAISNERVAVEVPESLGYPDGMAIDAEDKLWVGLWNGDAVVRFDPETGQLMQKIPVPAHNVTACAFGGPNLDTLYITTASLDMTPEEQEQFPLAGALFKTTVPGVTGVESTPFKMAQKQNEE